MNNHMEKTEWRCACSFPFHSVCNFMKCTVLSSLQLIRLLSQGTSSIASWCSLFLIDLILLDSIRVYPWAFCLSFYFISRTHFLTCGPIQPFEFLIHFSLSTLACAIKPFPHDSSLDSHMLLLSLRIFQCRVAPYPRVSWCLSELSDRVGPSGFGKTAGSGTLNSRDRNS